MDEIYVPVLHFFENGNGFTGSAGALRFFLTVEEGEIRARIWHGPLCFEKSEVEREARFPLDADGRAALCAFLEENR